MESIERKSNEGKENEEMKFRDLTKNDIECRVQSISSYQGEAKGLILLLYKNARVDMNILDETVGAENWQRDHFECKGNLYCKVGINTNFEHPELPDRWIWKSDCGSESNTEAEKGEASDSFKRACVNWGIGRELYTSPFIWIEPSDCNIKKNAKGVFECRDKFSVEDIKIENKIITALSIKNEKTKGICFSTGFKAPRGKVRAVPKPEETTEYKCTKCGKPFIQVTDRTGKVWTPQEQFEKTNGLCADCRKK